MDFFFAPALGDPRLFSLDLELSRRFSFTARPFENVL
jgi:hypothetical protein